MKWTGLLLAFFTMPAICDVRFPFVQSFMPENNLYLFDKLTESVNISEDEFNDSIDEVQKYYAPIVEKYRAKLVMVKDWEDPTVNAYATRMGQKWEVHLFGGLARRSEVSRDGFQLVVCHEMGHHLGGFPYVQQWAANDGQSDYFSTLSCAREIWKYQHARNEEAAMKIEIYPKRLCDNAWEEIPDRQLCYRIAIAGKSLADLLSSGTARYENPDKRIVTKTNNQHPPGQCRLDTYLAGAICKADFNPLVIPKDEKQASKYACLDSRKEMGARPKCWFKEGSL
jgi:hypothetical protein